MRRPNRLLRIGTTGSTRDTSCKPSKNSSDGYDFPRPAHLDCHPERVSRSPEERRGRISRAYGYDFPPASIRVEEITESLQIQLSWLIQSSAQKTRGFEQLKRWR